MTRFEQFKAKYATPDSFSEMLFRLHGYTTEAMKELDSSATKDGQWKKIGENAQKLLDNMPESRGAESVLTVALFLTSLDHAN